MFTKDQLTTVVMTLFVWGFAGALFGALFAGLYQVLQMLGFIGWQPLIAAAALAAMTTSAFYSAMPVALVGAMAGVLASISYLIVIGQEIELITMITTAGIFGMIAGGFYAWMMTGGSQSLAEALTGLSSGLFAGITLALLLAVTEKHLSMFALAAAVVAVVGSLFQISEQWLVARSMAWLPSKLSAPIVAGLVATVVGASIGIMDGATALNTNAQDMLGMVLHEVPHGLWGGLCGGAFAGLVLELLGFHLEDRL
ncbi:spermidine synthase [Chromatium weissei]|nr:spermidine synthase [Chromatium weissei]